MSDPLAATPQLLASIIDQLATVVEALPDGPDKDQGRESVDYLRLVVEGHFMSTVFGRSTFPPA